MKKIKFFGNILFWLTLISPPISFALICLIGEANIFGVAGMVRYSWVMWLFIPVGIMSVIISIILKNSNQNFKKNLIIVFICLPLLLIFGSFRFIFNNVSYDVSKIAAIEDKINIEIPHEIKVTTNKFDLYDVTYTKITNIDSKKFFEQEIRNSRVWQSELNSKIKSLLPLDIQYETEAFDYFVFYNVTDDKYNQDSINGECEIIFVAYDCDLQRLIILDGYGIKTN